MVGQAQVQSMFIDLWKRMHKLLGTVVENSAVDVKMQTVRVVLREETVRQLKARVRGGSAYTLAHTLTCTSDIELVPDMCPEKQRRIYKATMLPMLWGLSTGRRTTICGKPMCR